MAEGAAGRLHGRTLPAPAFTDTGGTAGRCDSGAAGHQGKVEGVRRAVEQEEYEERLYPCNESVAVS